MKTKEEVIEKIKKDLAGEPAKRDELLKAWEQHGKQPAKPDIAAKEEISKGGRAGLSYYYGYDNYSQSESNTCGQAVIASAVDFYGLNPYNLQKNYKGPEGRLHFVPDEILGNIYQNFGPTLNLVTFRETIRIALANYGLKSDEAYAGVIDNGENAKADLKSWIAKYQLPVIVLLDQGSKMFGSNISNYTPHWCTVFAYDDNNVYIGTWGGEVITANWQDFMDAWHCWFLPYPNNYYMITFWK